MVNLSGYLVSLTSEPDACLQMESAECRKVGAIFGGMAGQSSKYGQSIKNPFYGRVSEKWSLDVLSGFPHNLAPHKSTP